MIKYEMMTEKGQTGVKVNVHFSGPQQAIKELSQMNMFVIDRMITTFMQDKVDTPEMSQFIEVFKKQLCDNIMKTDTMAVHKQFKETNQVNVSAPKNAEEKEADAKAEDAAKTDAE